MHVHFQILDNKTNRELKNKLRPTHSVHSVGQLTDVWAAKRLLRMRRGAAAGFRYFFHSPQKQDGQSDHTTIRRPRHLRNLRCLI